MKLRRSEDSKDLKKEIVKTFGNCCNLVIPKSMATYYGIQVSDHVVLEYQQEGILIRKLEV
jgi:hypothetical protein